MRPSSKHLALAVLSAFAAPMLAVACGDAATSGADAGADAAPTTTTTTPPTATTVPVQDASVPDSSPTTDAGDAGPALAPVVPESAQRVVGALNPYGLVWGADGHLYMSGATLVAGDRQLAVWRFDKTTNKLDTTFGNGGVLTVPIGGDETSYDLVELKDGSFVVQATSNGKVWLVKMAKAANGTFSFETPKALVFGWEEADFASWPVAGAAPTYASWGIALDKSNAAAEKLVVFAYGAPAKVTGGGTQRVDNDRWVARVLATDFSNDATFAGGRPYTTDVDAKGLPDDARRGIVEKDGTIVSAGYTDFGVGPSVSVVLLRLKPDGTADTTFGFGSTSPGQTKFNPFQGTAGTAEAYSVVKQSSGRYVTTGYGKSSFDTATLENDLLTFGVLRDGVDPTYGRLGAWAIQSEKNGAAGLGTRPFRDNGRDLVVLADDRTVQVGCYDDFASIALFDKKGTLDKSFGTNGVVSYAHGGGLYKVALSADGKRIAASAQSVIDTSLLVTLKIQN